MLNYHILNYLSENIYSIYDDFNEEELDYEITAFFKELMSRRRNDDIEEGLQAGGVILPDKAGLKIAERDGMASHAQTQENVSQYLNGESSFSSEEIIGFFNGHRKKDPNAWMNIPKYGFVIRIVATEDTLIFIFNTSNYNITNFQLDIIYKLFSCMKLTYQNKEIKYPYINVVTPNKRFVFNEYKEIDEQLDKIENFILERKSNNKKTRVI